MPKKSLKRKDYISWDEYFMGIAILSAQRSKDPTTQLGACIVDDEKRIIGIGYNGFPRGCSDDQFSWKNESNKFTDVKDAYVVHSEVNAILNSTRRLRGTIMYVMLYPCNECAKMIIQSGIKKVVYLYDYRHKEKVEATKKMFQSAGVIIKKFPKSKAKNIEVDFNSKKYYKH
ncbi:MAG: deoxycytidylate deaminase [Nanobdellota archaeon]